MISAEHERGAGAGAEPPAPLPPVPELGQVVNVRGATWAVTDVRQQGLPRSPADEGTAGLTHVVDLQSLDEDRLGQELAVVWELEVGHTVAPDQGLPESISPGAFDDFGLDFVIVNSDLMARVRRTHGLNANPFRLFPRVIVSMAWLPTLRAQRLLREVYADAQDTATARRFAFDVLVVDEAHHVAPASPATAPGQRGYALDSHRTTATKALAEKCEHRLFLSATPHNGYSESFTALLEMIDGRRFKRGADLDEQALREITIRRLKVNVPEKDFKKRQLKSILFTPGDDEQRQFAVLDRILTDSARANGKGRSGGIVTMLLKKRFLSSPWSFALTLELYEQAAVSGYQLEFDDEEQYYGEVLGSGQSDEEEGEAEHPEFTALRQSKGSDPLVTATSQEVASLIRGVSAISTGRTPGWKR